MGSVKASKQKVYSIFTCFQSSSKSESVSLDNRANFSVLDTLYVLVNRPDLVKQIYLS